MAVVDWYWDDETFNEVVVRSNRAGIGAATQGVAVDAALIGTVLMAPHHANARAQEVLEGRKPRRPSYFEVKKGSMGIDAFLTLVDPDGSAGAISNKLNVMFNIERHL